MTDHGQLIDDSIKLKAIMELFERLDSSWNVKFYSVNYVCINKYETGLFGDFCVNFRSTQGILNACVSLDLINARHREQKKRTGEI